MKKALFSIIIATICCISAQSQSTNAFGDWELMCWDSAGVITPVQVRVSTSNSTGTLIRTYYKLTPSLQKVVPTTGVITYCENQQLQEIVINLQAELVKNDTIIVRLDSLLNTPSVVNELGCLTLYDTAGCGVVGLYTGIDGITPGWNNVYLNGNYIFASRQNSCDNLAHALNAPIFNVPGTWSCCNDSLVVASLDTSLFWRLDFVSTITGDTVTHFFDDTTGTDITTTILDVEIIKLIDKYGNISSLRYFSTDGTTEYTGQGDLKLGPCQSAETTTFQEYVTTTINNVNNYLGDCNTLANEWRLETITGNTTYNANTFNSIAITAVSGTVTVNTDGAGTVSLNVGDVYTIRANACSYVQTNVVVGVTAGSATISRYY